MYVFKRTGGLGNTLIHLTTLDTESTVLHDSIHDYELSNCLVIKDFTCVSYEGEQPDTPIILNPYMIHYVHTKIRNIIEPTLYMKRLIEKNMHTLDGVSCGMAIRRGSYCEDSRQYKDERSDQPHFFHCSESGLECFKEKIRNSEGKIFITSDSQSTLKSLMDEFGDKLVTIDTIFSIGSEHHTDYETKYIDYHNIYLLFFLLSKCPRLFTTGGNRDLVGFSTYAYMAAIYGNIPFTIVFNN
jgi:hypothetical protein